MNILELSEQEIGRRQSLQQLREMGINPYPAAEFPVTVFSTDIKQSFKEDEKTEVVIAGRMMSRRVMGKASFVELQDGKGRIQVYVTRDDICPEDNKDLYNVSSRSCSTLATSSAYAVSSSRHRPARSPSTPKS